MSETPTLPLDEFKTGPVHGPEQLAPTEHDQRAFFKYAEQQLSPERSADRWDLDEPVTAFDPEASLYEAADYTTAPEYATTPMTRAQEIERSLFYLDDKELLSYVIANTQAVWALKKLA